MGYTGCLSCSGSTGIFHDVTGVAITIENCPTVAAIAAGDCTLAQTTLNNGDQCTYRSAACVPALTDGAKFSADVTVDYTNAETGLAHSTDGTITTRVEP